MMEQLIQFLSETESRDKVLKVLAYFSRLMQAVLNNKDLAERFSGVFQAARDARKVFRLGKSLNEISSILAVYRDLDLTSSDKTYNILSRSGFMIYWFLDNIFILSFYKVLRFDYNQMTRVQMTTWFISLFFALILYLRNLMKSFAEEAMLKESAVGHMTESQVADKLDEISIQRWTILLNIARTLGDMIPAANWAEIPFLVLGKQFSEKWCGIGGLVAATIGCCQLWPH